MCIVLRRKKAEENFVMPELKLITIYEAGVGAIAEI
jgi:hypothetical protein